MLLTQVEGRDGFGPETQHGKIGRHPSSSKCVPRLFGVSLFTTACADAAKGRLAAQNASRP
jgi:hypothetical protein